MAEKLYNKDNRNYFHYYIKVKIIIKIKIKIKPNKKITKQN